MTEEVLAPVSSFHVEAPSSTRTPGSAESPGMKARIQVFKVAFKCFHWAAL